MSSLLTADWRSALGDRIKLILAFLILLIAFVIPIIGFFIGWYKWDPWSGLLIMIISAVVLIMIGAVLLFTIRKQNWFSITLPFIFSSLYTILPDFLQFRLDDTLVNSLGAVITYGLLLRRDRNAPKWLLVPLIVGVIYSFVGVLIPGPFDELIVELVSLAVYAAGVYRQKSDSDTIEVVTD